MAKDTSNYKGRVATFATKKSVAKVLRDYIGGNEVSRFLKLQLVEMGYLAVKPIDTETPRRGRKAHSYELSGKGRGLVALSKNWKLG